MLRAGSASSCRAKNSRVLGVAAVSSEWQNSTHPQMTAGSREQHTWMTASLLWRCCSRSCRRRSRSRSSLLSASSSILSTSGSSAAAATSLAALPCVPEMLLQGDTAGGLLIGLPEPGRPCLDSCMQTARPHGHRCIVHQQPSSLVQASLLSAEACLLTFPAGSSRCRGDNENPHDVSLQHMGSRNLYAACKLAMHHRKV